MKKILMVGKMKGNGKKKSVVINLAAAREMMFAAAAKAENRSGKLSVRQMDNIHARTGIPWARLNEEAKKEGL